MKKDFKNITAGLIIEELRNEGLPISRSTLFRRMKDIDNCPQGSRAKSRIKGGHQWRIFSREEAEKIKLLMKRNYPSGISS